MQRQPLAVIQDPSNPGTPSGDSQNAMPFSTLQTSYQSAAARSRINPTANSTNMPQQVVVAPPQQRSRINPSANSTSNMPQQVVTSPVHHSQRLKVEDALTYLDQVKIKFSQQPQVYNDFLDIMKEFKSQSIDTPGVIQRVSNLFKGHSSLITGFNTFLPPGYKIDVLANNEISVSMPPNIASTPSTKNTPNSHTPVVTTSSSLSLQTGNNSQRPSLGSNQGSGSGGTGPYSGSSALSSPSPTHPSSPLSGSQPTTQPVEFNHAINYVNKIKHRFMGQPDIYKQFLEILHTYQKEQRIAKDGQSHHNQKVLTESEVYMQVATLFQNQADLLQEFGQFLPDANGGSNQLVNLHQQTQQQSSPTVTTSSNLLTTIKSEPGTVTSSVTVTPKKSSSLHHHHHHHHHKSSGLNSSSKSLKRSGSNLVPSSVKKMKMTSLDDITFAEAGKYGTLVEFAFFDKVHSHLKNKEDYDNFMRCIILYNQEVISRTELLKMVTPFLSKWPELFKWFKDFLGLKEVSPNEPNKLHERLGGEFASTEIDYSSCKKYGTSYRALPKNYVQPKCSGRTPLCKEVLNDTWVSFPSWSEDSTFVSSKKTPYEESIYRCEDERFELDVVIEINSSCIRSFESIAKKIARMSVEEKAKFHLDDSLGSSSTVINKQAITRIYGDKAPDVIEGLKKNPVLAIPIVLRRLKEKEEEWKAAQRSFNKVWREQNEKFYLKSLDHQGITFKQTDAKYIRSKNLLNEIETIFEERQDQGEDDPGGPHLALFYRDKTILEDAANLIIHHVKRQTSINKDDKHKIKVLLRHFIPDFFSTPRGTLSDDEIEAEDDNSTSAAQTDAAKLLCTESLPKADGKNQECLLQSPLQNKFQDDSYSLFLVNSHWYLFFRLHNILCERLLKIYNCSTDLAAEEAKEKKNRDIAVSEALRLKPKNEFDVEEYYPAFLDLVKGLLDNNVESTQFEDALREMFGIHAYQAFTLDKVVGNAVRQLQNIVAAGGTGLQCKDLYLQEQRNLATGGPCVTAVTWAGAESAYQRKAEALLAEESCYKIIFYKKEGKMSIEMLDSYSENSEYEHCENWSNFVEEYARTQNLSEEMKEALTRKKPFLLRNTKSVKDSMKKQNEEDGVTMITNQSGLFKRESLYKARKMHRSITLRKNERFRSWHNLWACENVSPEMDEILKKWFLESNIVCHHFEPSLTRTPYLAYNKYHSSDKQL